MLGKTYESKRGRASSPSAKQALLEYVGIGTIAGATAATVNLGVRGVADVGDLLGFVGAAVGAGLAVIGAIYVESRKRSNEAETARAGIDRMLDNYIGFVTARTEDAIAAPDLHTAQLVAEISADRLASVIRYCCPRMAAMSDPDAVHCGFWLETDGAESIAKLRKGRNELESLKDLKLYILAFYEATRAQMGTVLEAVRRAR